MARDDRTPPAVRESEYGIEIDCKRGKWPFFKAVWGEDHKGRTRLVLISDANEQAMPVTQGSGGVGIVGISKKKARALRDFLDRTLDEV